MTDYQALRERCRTDARFYKVVHMLLNVLDQALLTPDEIRSAADCAAMEFYLTHAEPVIILRDQT